MFQANAAPQPILASAFQRYFSTPRTGDYLTYIVDLMRPISPKGVAKLNSIYPFEQPYLNLKSLTHEVYLILRFMDDIKINGEGTKDLIEGDYPWPMRL
jgi:choline dehydrogenase